MSRGLRPIVTSASASIGPPVSVLAVALSSCGLLGAVLVVAGTPDAVCRAFVVDGGDRVDEAWWPPEQPAPVVAIANASTTARPPPLTRPSRAPLVEDALVGAHARELASRDRHSRLPPRLEVATPTRATARRSPPPVSMTPARRADTLRGRALVAVSSERVD